MTRRALIAAGVLGAAAIAAGAVWSWLTPDEEPWTEVPYSDFLAEVHAGKVLEIRVHDTRYRFLSKGPNGLMRRQAIGPKADSATAASLKPDDPAASAPTLRFE